MTIVPDKRKLIAIVEDDPHLTGMFSDVLHHYGDWEICVFSDGKSAQEALPELGAHLILLDVGLPALDGVSLYKILQGHNRTRHIPIVLVTGSYDWELHRQGLQTGILLRKPFSLQELISVIRALLPEEEERED